MATGDRFERRHWRFKATSNSQTDVAVSPSPQNQPPTTIVVQSIRVYNADTANVDFTIKIDDGGTEHIIARQTLATLKPYVEHGDNLVTLEASTEVLQLVLAANVTTNQIQVVLSGFEITNA